MWMHFPIKKPLNAQTWEFRDSFYRGANQIWTGDRGVADLCLTTWLWRRIYFALFYTIKMTPTGIEPVLPPWKGDVLTAWPWSHTFFKRRAPRVGLEPTTTRLTAECSTIELSRNILYLFISTCTHWYAYKLIVHSKSNIEFYILKFPDVL